MVDRMYKVQIPNIRRRLERLRKEFGALPSTTDWNGLRVSPLLAHVRSLEAVLRSTRHAREIARLTRGVPMFHSDLVYLQHNVKELGRTLNREKRALGSKR